MPRDRNIWYGPRRVWEYVVHADRFVRLHYLFFTCLWPLMGAAAVRRDLTAREIVGLLAVTVCFHIYAFLLNDVVDLPIDRTHPSRQTDPLVRGTIRPSHSLLIALVQPFLAIQLTRWLGGTWSAHVTLVVGFVSMGIYNVWGKRCRFPPLTDAIQGVGWGSLAVYAPQAFGREPDAMSWIVGAYVAVFTLLFNGIHGDLRDLATDLAGGARTTAIFLGARPATSEGGQAYVPRAVMFYASVVLALLIGMNATLIVRNDFGYGPVTWTVTAIVVGGFNLAAAVLQPKVVRPRGAVWDPAWRLQLYLLMMSIPIAFFAHLSAGVLIVLALLTLLSLSLFGCTSMVARWVWLTTASAIRPVDEKGLDAGVSGTD